jgi:hypothetical protein
MGQNVDKRLEEYRDEDEEEESVSFTVRINVVLPTNIDHVRVTSEYVRFGL